MPSDKTVLLNTGVEMPMVGLGTYLSGPGKEAEQAVSWALEAGYRLIGQISEEERTENRGGKH